MRNNNIYLLNKFIYFNLALYIVLFQIQNVNIFWLVNNLILNILILTNTKKITSKLLSLFILTLFISIFLFFYSELKFSSFILSLFLIISAILQLNFIYNTINYIDFKKILLSIFLTFCFVYILQCICVVLHLPIINGFGLTKENTSIFRLNSFSPEPSMASQLIILIMYIVNIHHFLTKKNFIKFELAALFLMLLFGSVFGYISLLIYVLVVHRKFHPLFFKFELIIGSFLIFYFLNTSETLYRISSLLNYMWTEFDIDKLASIEPSGSFRFYPLLFYFQNFDITNFHYYFGFGPGVSSTFFNEGLRISGFGLDLDSNFQGGFIPSFFIDYGLITTFTIIYFIVKNCILKHNIFEYSFLFLLLMNTNINTQLFWFYIFVTFISKYIFLNRTNLKFINPINE